MEVVSSAHIDGVVQTSPSLRRRSVVPPAVEVSRIASGALGESSQTREGDKAGDLADFFSCSICLELAHDPVVTVCGHLHCWPCLYRRVTPPPRRLSWPSLEVVCSRPVCELTLFGCSARDDSAKHNSDLCSQISPVARLTRLTGDKSGGRRRRRATSALSAKPH